MRRLWATEINPVLTPPKGVDLSAYAAALVVRFANHAIRHRAWQIAMDGSQKLPQRILGTVESNRPAGRKSPRLLLAIAARMTYVGGVDEKGQPIDVRDPFADRLRELSVGPPEARGATLLSVGEAPRKPLPPTSHPA